MENLKRIDTGIRGLRRYRYPGPAQDHLCRADYVHLARKVSCDQCGCDSTQRTDNGDENYGPRVVVHRGTIASGEVVMKNEVLRDQLAKQYGVLCSKRRLQSVG